MTAQATTRTGRAHCDLLHTECWHSRQLCFNRNSNMTIRGNGIHNMDCYLAGAAVDAPCWAPHQTATASVPCAAASRCTTTSKAKYLSPQVRGSEQAARDASNTTC